MAPVPLVAATNTSSADVSGGATSHACALPSGIAAGNLLVVAAAVYGTSSLTGATPSLPSGWTNILNVENVNAGQGVTTSLRIFQKIATGSEGSTVTVSWSGASGTALAVAAISARITGHDPAGPIDVSASTNNSGTLPAVTVTSGKVSSLLLGGSVYQFPSGAPSTPSGWTALAGVTQAAWTVNNQAIYKTITSSGSTGTQSYVTSPQGIISWSIAVAPQPAQLVGMSAITNTPTLNQPAVSTTKTVGPASAISNTPTLRSPSAHHVIIAAAAINQTPVLNELGGEIRFTLTALDATPVVNTHAVSAPNTEQRIGAAATIDSTPVLATPASVEPTDPFLVGGSYVGSDDLVGGGTFSGSTGTAGGLIVTQIIRLPAIVNTPTVNAPTVRQVIQLAAIDQTAELHAPRVRGVVAFLPAARILPWGASRTWNAWVEFLVAGEVVARSDDGTFALVGGKITEDITRSICRDATLSLAFPGDTSARNALVPTDIGDLLDANAGTQFRVWAGYVDEEVLLGTFDITSSPVKAGAGGAEIELQGQSLERLLQKAGFWQIEGTDDGSNVVVVIGDLVEEAIPDVVVLAESIATTTSALTWKPGDDRLSKIAEMASVAGVEFSFDRDNNFVMRKAPTVYDFGQIGANWEVVDGFNARVATLNSVTRQFSDDNAFNGVVIEGDSHSDDNAAPILYTLWNDDPSSPMYFDPDNPRASRVGPRAKYIRSELVRTEADAQAMAQVELAKVLAISDSMTVEVPANANIKMGDYARVASEALGVDDVYRIARVDHDLAGGPAQLSVYRQQRV